MSEFGQVLPYISLYQNIPPEQKQLQADTLKRISSSRSIYIYIRITAQHQKRIQDLCVNNDVGPQKCHFSKQKTTWTGPLKKRSE